MVHLIKMFLFAIKIDFLTKHSIKIISFDINKIKKVIWWH